MKLSRIIVFFQYATPYLVDVAPGSAGLKTNVFWIWGGCCCIAFVFAYFVSRRLAMLTK